MSGLETYREYRLIKAPLPFRALFYADWSTTAKKRWVAEAARKDAGWNVASPRLLGDTRAFVDELFTAVGPVLAGFDFPIGVPATYGKMTGFADFPTALKAFGQGEWAEFFTVAETPEQVSRTRPFYPRVSTSASKQAHLLCGLGVESINVLRRRCELATPTRPAACPLFWTLGGSQVGKAAISGWQDVITSAQERGARLWPFEGSLAELAEASFPVLAETYPAEAYRHVSMAFRANMSKRRRDDRRAVMAGLAKWAYQHSIIFSAELNAQIEDGFGARSDGEDRFDAFAGLLGMIEVTDGRRLESPPEPDDTRRWEGWILGQAA